jgi:hypothetical protein
MSQTVQSSVARRQYVRIGTHSSQFLIQGSSQPPLFRLGMTLSPSSTNASTFTANCFVPSRVVFHRYTFDGDLICRMVVFTNGAEAFNAD